MAANELTGLYGILPRVENPLRTLHRDGRSGKTPTNYADGIALSHDWCVK